MSECLRCGQLDSSGLFCNQCHSSLLQRFQKKWYRDGPSNVSPLRLNALVHTVCSPQFVKRSPFSFVRGLSIVFTLMVIPVFVVATIQASFVFSRYQSIPTSIRTFPIVSSTPASQIGKAALSAQDSDDLKGDVNGGFSTNRSVLGVSPEYLLFSVIQGQADPPDQAVAIANIGTGDLTWHVQNDNTSSSWLHINTTAGSLTGGQITQIDLHVYVTGLIAGSYRAHVFTSATDSSGIQVVESPQTFIVQLDVLGITTDITTP